MKGRKPVALALINPNEGAYTLPLGVDYGVLINGWEVSSEPQPSIGNEITVEGRSVFLAAMP